MKSGVSIDKHMLAVVIIMGCPWLAYAIVLLATWGVVSLFVFLDCVLCIGGFVFVIVIGLWATARVEETEPSEPFGGM